MGEVVQLAEHRSHGLGQYGEAPVTEERMAAELGLTPRTLYNYRRRGCPYEPWGLRYVRYYPSRVRAWLREQRSS